MLGLLLPDVLSCVILLANLDLLGPDLFGERKKRRPSILWKGLVELVCNISGSDSKTRRGHLGFFR